MGLLDWIPGRGSNSSTPSATPTSPIPSSSPTAPPPPQPEQSPPSLLRSLPPVTPPPPPPPPVSSSTPSDDDDQTLMEEISTGTAPETTDTNLRYAGYGARIRTILSATHRYVAYTSDIGESFRPVAHPFLIRSAYGVSWAYILGDVGYEGYKAYLAQEREKNGIAPPATTAIDAPPHHSHRAHPQDYRLAALQRLIFQSLASMALPAFTIHSVVRYSGRALKGAKNARIRTWGPVGLGLAVVPGLPYLFDEPVERGVEWVFEKGEEVVGGMGKGTADKVKTGGDSGKSREL